MMEIFNECSTLITKANDITVTKLVKSTQSIVNSSYFTIVKF